MDSPKFAVLFDMDGVLVDNSEFHARAFEEYFTQATGKPFAFTAEHFGKTNEDILSMAFPDASSELLDKYALEKEAYYRKIYKPHIKPMPGLIDLLGELKKAGIPVAVGSSAPPENIDFALDELNIRPYFRHIVNGLMVTRGKPDPEIYLKAASLLKMPPSRCIVFEDSLAGITAGRSAGAKVIGVTTTFGRDVLESRTDKIIDDFTQINIDQLGFLIDNKTVK